MARITLVSRNFPPLTGGMERLVHEVYRKLLCNHEVALLGPSGCEAFVDSARGVRATTISPTPIFLLFTFLKGFYLHLTSGHPDIVIGGSGLVGPVVVLLAKLSGAKSVLLLHGLDIVADSRLYQWIFVPFLKRADSVVCNSRNTARLAIKKGVDELSIVIINPGVDLTGESISHRDAKQSLGLEGKTILLSIGRLIPRKGLAEFISASFADLATDDAEIVLLIAGSEASDAINRSGLDVLSDIEAAIASHGLAEQVQLLGHVDDDEIPALYAAADVFVFPLVETRGDVEGFGMVAVEAAAHGTPTVAFDCGGVSDAVVDGINGFLVPPGSYSKFSAAVVRLIHEDMRSSAREFASRFSWNDYGVKMNACIEKVLSEVP